ncbi:MAG: hypothetical protein II573_02105 [Ruminococcus sp.]|nr:hypothetical protein [Ruminococcus sp.]
MQRHVAAAVAEKRWVYINFKRELPTLDPKPRSETRIGCSVTLPSRCRHVAVA